MSSGSYLYAIDNPPGATGGRVNAIGISEINWQIPLLYLLLVSDDPRPCRSCTFDVEPETAIYGSYEGGIRRAEQFLARLSNADLASQIAECLDFLKSPTHRRRFFILECAELFLSEEDSVDALPKHNQKLLADIKNIDSEIERYFKDVNEAKSGNRKMDLKHLIEQAGLDADWNNVLYNSPRLE